MRRASIELFIKQNQVKSLNLDNTSVQTVNKDTIFCPICEALHENTTWCQYPGRIM